MANKTINQLTSLGSVDANDEFVLYDVSADETKKATKSTLLSGMQTELTFDDTPTEDSDKPVTSDGIYTSLSGKQDTLTFDDTPTNGSSNPVTSGGIYTALSGKANGESFTLTSANPKSVSLPFYRCGILGGWARGQGVVLLALFNNGGTLAVKDLNAFGDWNNYKLTFSLSDEIVTIKSVFESFSEFTFIPLGF